MQEERNKQKKSELLQYCSDEINGVPKKVHNFAKAVLNFILKIY